MAAATTTTAAPATAGERVAVCPDLYTAGEAAAYLRLPNVRAFNARRRALNVTGRKAGKSRLYCREQLEGMRLRMFGLAR